MYVEETYRGNQVGPKSVLHGKGKKILCFYHHGFSSVWEQAVFLYEGHIKGVLMRVFIHTYIYMYI